MSRPVLQQLWVLGSSDGAERQAACAFVALWWLGGGLDDLPAVPKCPPRLGAPADTLAARDRRHVRFPKSSALGKAARHRCRRARRRENSPSPRGAVVVGYRRGDVQASGLRTERVHRAELREIPRPPTKIAAFNS